MKMKQTVFHHSSSLQLPHATVSCVECVSVALLYEQVLLSFFGCDAASLLPRSPSLSDFVRIYRQQCSRSPAKETRYIVSAMPFTLNQKINPRLACQNIHGTSYYSFLDVSVKCWYDNMIRSDNACKWMLNKDAHALA